MEVAELIGAQLMVLESKCGHLIFECELEQISAAVSRFLDEQRYNTRRASSSNVRIAEKCVIEVQCRGMHGMMPSLIASIYIPRDF